MKSIFFATSMAFILILLFVKHSIGQPAPVKWGKYSQEEIRMSFGNYDKEAAAIVLCEYGTIKFSGSFITISKHVRIKILDENGLSFADVTLPYWYKDNLEEITTLKAQTANFNVSGKPQIDKVSNNQIFNADIDENWKAKKFTFPNVKKGSIIEYDYATISKNFTFLDDWIFQNAIPILHSELRVMIPETLDYISFTDSVQSHH